VGGLFILFILPWAAQYPNWWKLGTINEAEYSSIKLIKLLAVARAFLFPLVGKL